MWIPHQLLSPLKAEGPKEAVLESEQAKDTRSFVVGFVLCNMLTRAWETDLIVSAADSERIVDIDGASCTVHAAANEAGKLHEIVYAVPATGAVEALAMAFRHADGELSRMALHHGRSFEIAGWRVADVEHGARWRCVPFRPSALKSEPLAGELPPLWQDILGLYREARNASGATWRLISGGAILDAAVSGRAPFDEVRIDLGAQPLTFDMLARSGTLAAHPEFKGATARKLWGVVEPIRQSFIRQLGGGPGVHDRGDYAATLELAALANLTDLVARELVMTSLRAAGFVREAEPVERPELATT